MEKQKISEKTFGCNITGCSPKCPYFPNAEGEIPWHYGEDGLKHRDEKLMRCGYNGSFITSWNRVCPMKEDKLKMQQEKEKKEADSKPMSNASKKSKYRHKKKVYNKNLTKK